MKKREQALDESTRRNVTVATAHPQHERCRCPPPLQVGVYRSGPAGQPVKGRKNMPPPQGGPDKRCWSCASAKTDGRVADATRVPGSTCGAGFLEPSYTRLDFGERSRFACEAGGLRSMQLAKTVREGQDGSVRVRTCNQKHTTGTSCASLCECTQTTTSETAHGFVSRPVHAQLHQSRTKYVPTTSRQRATQNSRGAQNLLLGRRPPVRAKRPEA